MSSKTIIFNPDAQAKVIRGVDVLADAVEITMGPAGSYVMIDKKYSLPIYTKDGVSVAKEILLPDPFENMGARSVEDAASVTVNEVGDGTSTATALARTMIHMGLGADRMSKMGIQKGMKIAVGIVHGYLDSIRADAPIGSKVLTNVINISANGDESIINTVTDCINQAGQDAQITVREGRGVDDEISVTGGLLIERGYESAYFVTDASSKVCEIDDALVYLSKFPLTTVSHIETVINTCIENNKGLIVIAPSVSDDALKMLIENKMKGGLQCVAIKAPNFGDRRDVMMNDIATATGGEVITLDSNYTDGASVISYLGVIDSAKVTESDTILFLSKDYEDEVLDKVEGIQEILDTASKNETTDAEREFLELRINKMKGNIAIVYAGGNTEAEMKERKDRLDDAVLSALAATKQGVVPGGGVALLNAAASLNLSSDMDEAIMFGINIVKKSLSRPIDIILKNAEINTDIISKLNLFDGGLHGVDASNGTIVNMFEAGIVDPLLVSKSAIKNAAAIASMIICTRCAIVENEEVIQHFQS